MKTYICSMSDPTIPYYDTVVEKTERAVQSCKDMGYEYTVIYGPTPTDRMHETAAELGVTLEHGHGTDCCNLSHMLAYRAIWMSGQVGCLMEYDGYWVKPMPEIAPEVLQDNVVINVGSGDTAEGIVFTPGAAGLFYNFRRAQETTEGITDHLVNMRQRFPRGWFNQPKYHWMYNTHKHIYAPGFVAGNENGTRDNPKAKYIGSVRRLIDSGGPSDFEE